VNLIRGLGTMGHTNGRVGRLPTNKKAETSATKNLVGGTVQVIAEGIKKQDLANAKRSHKGERNPGKKGQRWKKVHNGNRITGPFPRDTKRNRTKPGGTTGERPAKKVGRQKSWDMVQKAGEAKGGRGGECCKKLQISRKFRNVKTNKLKVRTIRQ